MRYAQHFKRGHKRRTENGRYVEEYSTLFELLKCAIMEVIQAGGAGNVVEEGSVWSDVM